jgi:hypothetical protein
MKGLTLEFYSIFEQILSKNLFPNEVVLILRALKEKIEDKEVSFISETKSIINKTSELTLGDLFPEVNAQKVQSPSV